MPNRSFDLFSVGDASVDTYVQVPFIVGPDQKAMGTWLGQFGGGMAANFAAAAANVGARTSFMSVHGDDEAGRLLIQELVEHGVDTRLVKQVDHERTFQCFVQLDARGEKALFGASPGQKTPRIDEIPSSALQDAKYVYALADDLDWAREMSVLAKRNGCRFAVDLERSAVDAAPALASQVGATADIVFTNVEAFRSMGLTADEVLKHLLDWGTPLAVVTNGAQGSAVSDGETLVRSSGLVTQVVDSTGAGDAHNGGFLGSLVLGGSITEALATATAMGALCVEHLGARGYRTGLHRLPHLIELAKASISVAKYTSIN